jgi:antitoxin YefM
MRTISASVSQAAPLTSWILTQNIANPQFRHYLGVVQVSVQTSFEEEPAMTTATYTAFRERLADYMEQVCDNHEVLHVTRQKARTIVVLSEEEYEGLVETTHLLRSPVNAARLRRSIADANAGKFIEREI